MTRVARGVTLKVERLGDLGPRTETNEIAEAVVRALEGSAPRTPWMTTEEAARHLRISTDALKKLVAAGVVPVHKLGERRNRYYRPELDEWLLHGRAAGSSLCR